MRLSKDITAFIRAARIAHLATADTGGQPHVIPICFAFDGKEFFSAIDEKPKQTEPRKLKRLRNIEQNPQVALVIDHYGEDWRQLAYVLVTGKARIIFSGAKHTKAVALLRRKYSQYRTMRIHERPMIVITPKQFRSWSSGRSVQKVSLRGSRVER